MREKNIPLTAKELVSFIKTSVTNAGFSRVVGNVSGGIDSAIATALASAALGPQNVFTLLLPYKDWHTEASRQARQLLHNLEIPSSHIFEIDIAPIVEAFQQTLKFQLRAVENSAAEAELDTLRVGNVMARVRMVILFDYAKKLNALVLGTENKTEHYLGYYTRFGDEASDIEPLRNLYKTEIYQLADYLQIPKEIREAVPTAGLWPGQTDEGQFGFTYPEADEILYGLYEVHLSPRELVSRGLDDKVIEAVKTWVEKMAFKHNLPLIAP
jgi:NAD+ synthase